MAFARGTRVTVSPDAYGNGSLGHRLYKVSPKVYAADSLYVASGPDQDYNYLLVTDIPGPASNVESYRVYLRFVHKYKEPEVSDASYQYTIEDFERFITEAGLGGFVEDFKELVEASKPKNGEVWLVETYEGDLTYAKWSEDEDSGCWWGADMFPLDETVVAHKKIGVDE